MKGAQEPEAKMRQQEEGDEATAKKEDVTELEQPTSQVCSKQKVTSLRG